jgi:hypothetical protein
LTAFFIPLQRRAGEVDPHVAAAHEPARHAEVVVVEVDDPLGEARRHLLREQPLHEALAAVVARVRLPGQHELHGTLGAHELQ